MQNAGIDDDVMGDLNINSTSITTDTKFSSHCIMIERKTAQDQLNPHTNLSSLNNLIKLIYLTNRISLFLWPKKKKLINLFSKFIHSFIHSILEIDICGRLTVI